VFYFGQYLKCISLFHITILVPHPNIIILQDPIVSCKWLRPTTFEGDEQYLQFFPLLVQATEYGETKDHVVAKATVIARKSFQKMLRFQIDIAVEDCMDFLRIDEAMKRRYNLYYFAVSEIILNGKDSLLHKRFFRDGS